MIQDKRILVTGATGQVAASIAHFLARHNEVWAIARFGKPELKDRLEAAGVHTHACDFSSGDFKGLRDDFDYVVHAGASAHPKTDDEGMIGNAEGTGFLMNHCRTAKGFLHFSTCGVYIQNPDPLHEYVETDPMGGSTTYNMIYPITKIAAEGVARTMARLLGLPTILARLNTAYGGPYDDGGLTGRHLDDILAGKSIRLPKSFTAYQSPIHEDDICAHIEPLLKAASVPATIVNWGGDAPVAIEAWIRYIGALVGVEPKIEYNDEKTLPSLILDATRRKALGLDCKVEWKEGIRRQIRMRHPELTLRDVA